MGKWQAKFRTGKLRPGIAFIILHKSGICRKMAVKPWAGYQRWLLKKWNTNFRLKHYFVLKKRTTFSEIPLLQDFFHWKYLKCRVPLTFQPDFLETICKWWTTRKQAFSFFPSRPLHLIINWNVFKISNREGLSARHWAMRSKYLRDTEPSKWRNMKECQWSSFELSNIRGYFIALPPHVVLILSILQFILT